MNKFVLSALALTTAGGVALAGNETKGEWLSLDREIASLATTSAQAATTSGITLSGFIKTSYYNSDDLPGDPVGGTGELGGFSLNNARVNISGSIGRFSAYVQLEGASAYDSDGSVVDFVGNFVQPYSTANGVGVLDAYAAWSITDEIQLRMGNFRPPVLGSALLDENQLLFLNRTFNGELWSFRDVGVQLNGNFDRLGWWAALQNGLDGQADELSYALRVAFGAMGTGAMVEGAYGVGTGTNLTLAAAYTDDQFLDDGAAMALEAHFAVNNFAISGELVDYEEDLLDATPWTATASFLINNQFEVAARWEDIDDSADTTAITLGLNWYLEGHNAKWQINYTTLDSDVTSLEADILALGLVVSI